MTEEEARDAIVKAAVGWFSLDETSNGDDYSRSLADLASAVAAYRKATTPEPFDTFIRLPYTKGGHSNVSDRPGWFDTAVPGEIWKATVTPIERVR